MSENKNQDNVYSIKELWSLFLHHWYWFAISLFICLSVAIIYIVITPPTFTCAASILIKNNSKGTNASSASAESFIDLGLLNQNSDAKSELHVISSPELMEVVVSRLKLDYIYKINYRSVRLCDLYNTSPFLVQPDSLLQNATFSFDAKLLSNNKIVLNNIFIGNEEQETSIEGEFNKPIPLIEGGASVMIVPTATLNDYVGQEILFAKTSISDIANKSISQIQVKLSDDGAPIINLLITDESAQKAEDILSAMISVYNENWIKDKNQVTLSTSQFIDDRLKVIENELGSVDKNISTYKSSNLLPDVNAVAGMYLSQSNTNAQKMINTQNQLSMAKYIRSYMGYVTNKGQLLPANTGIENVAIESQIEKYNELMLQKNTLITNSSENNPLIADMMQQLVAMKEVIVRSIDDYISILALQIDNIRDEAKTTNQKLASNPSQAKDLLSVERQQKIKEELYLFLLQKREENELSQAFTAYNTKLVNAPRGDKTPTAPRRNIVILVAFVLGFILPAIIIFVIESLNTLVKERKDLKGLSLPYLGEIPLISKKRFSLFNRGKEPGDENVKIVVQNKNRDFINEAFRSVRTNIDFIYPPKDAGAVIMSTSMYPGSGKTFITTNLALSMAIKGSKVLVIDVDLRKASLSDIVDSPDRGLSGYLNGTVDSWNSITIKGSVHPNMDVIPVGVIPPNPAELLLGDRFKGLLTALRSEYNYIFLDCPPIEIVTDTAIIGKVCDLTLFIIRAGLMDKRSLPEIEQLKSNGQYNNLVVILNGLEYKTNHYGYRKYGYGYGYGYSNCSK